MGDLNRNRIIKDDVVRGLRTLPDGCVQTVVTSPPYYKLRNYEVRGQIGLEDTVKEYVGRLVGVFGEVRRVLRDDGTFWLNLGVSYAGDGNSRESNGRAGYKKGVRQRVKRTSQEFKNKDLIGIPWMVALALQADGWWLRSEVIWHKPNPITASATDRPTVAHETIFLLSKNSRYFYDADAIREPFEPDSGKPMKTPGGWDTGKGAHGTIHRNGREKGHSTVSQTKGANRRSVWKFPAQPYKGAHFATFPERLPELCIKAGTSEAGACGNCGKPLERIVEKGAVDEEWKKKSGADKSGGYRGKATKNFKTAQAQNASDVKRRILDGMRERVTTGWRRRCSCKAKTVPCVVLDPFLGSGTTAVVAKKLGRDWTGIELSPESVELARKRIRKTSFEPDMFQPRPERARGKQAEMF